MTETPAEINADAKPAPARILLMGPTASGKSALAAALARRLDGWVLNADAMQVYADWRVLTARPGPDEERQAPHFLYGHVDAARAYSVGDWLRDAAPLLEAADAEGRPVVLVGGTGLFFTAATRGLADIPPTPPEVRDALERDLEARGAAFLAARLTAIDPETARRIDIANPRRVLRALEILEATGKGQAAWWRETAAPLIALERAAPLVLESCVGWLNARIAGRFHAMLGAGALEEAKALLGRGLDPSAPALKALGAPELFAHLSGAMTLEAAREAAIIATRQYAKRQRTWARRQLADWPRLGAEMEGGADEQQSDALLEKVLAMLRSHD